MNDNNTNRIGRPRPLSPHLQIYKLPLTAILSILHRASIIAMYFGVFGLILILADYAFVEHCACGDWLKNTSTGQIVTKIVLSGYALAASYWVCATIRHLTSDLGYGFQIKNAYRLSYITIAASLVLTAAIIYFGIL